MLTRKLLTEQDNIRLTDSDSELAMFSYANCTAEDTIQTKQSRGVIFNGDKLLAPSFGWTAEYTQNDKALVETLIKNGGDNVKVFDSHEGCLLRLFFHKKWYLVTHRRLDACKSRWSSTEYWGEMFKTALTMNYDKFVDSLDKTLIYFFVVRNNSENRIVCVPPEKSTVYHVGTMLPNSDKGTGDLRTWTTVFDIDIGITTPTEHVDTNVETLISYVEKNGYNTMQGVIVFTPDKIFKLYNTQYNDLLKVRGNEASIKFRYLQIRMDKVQRELLMFLYPEYCNEFEKYEMFLYKISLELTHSYIARFVRGEWKQVPKDEYETVIRPLREWHLENVSKNYICLETVINKLNSQSPQFLNKVIRRLKTNKAREHHNYKKQEMNSRRLLQPGFTSNFA
jgi:hypothetical protein